jgi:hypothetical protein
MVVSCKRERMLRYEAITFIQDVEVHDLSIDLASLIWVTASNFSYTPPSCVPLVNNCSAYIPSNVALEYLQGAFMWSVGSQAEAIRELERSLLNTLEVLIRLFFCSCVLEVCLAGCLVVFA